MLNCCDALSVRMCFKCVTCGQRVPGHMKRILRCLFFILNAHHSESEIFAQELIGFGG